MITLVYPTDIDTEIQIKEICSVLSAPSLLLHHPVCGNPTKIGVLSENSTQIKFPVLPHHPCVKCWWWGGGGGGNLG